MCKILRIFIALLAVIAIVTWGATCGLLYLVAVIFDLPFNFIVATLIWMVTCPIGVTLVTNGILRKVHCRK